METSEKTRSEAKPPLNGQEKTRKRKLSAPAQVMRRVDFDRMPFAEKLVAVRTGVRILD